MDIYKCPILKKGLRELKFQYIITLSASALPFCEGYLYAFIYKNNIIQTRALSREYKVRILFAKDGSENGKVVFG